MLAFLNFYYMFAYVSGRNLFDKPLNPKEEKYYIEEYEKWSVEAKNILIEKNLRLVAHIAKKYSSNCRDSEDLISIGTIGLIKAVSSYNSGKNVKLATYAAKCIDNAILSQMRLWFQTSTPRAKENPNGVFCHRFPRIYTYFVPLRTDMWGMHPCISIVSDW